MYYIYSYCKKKKVPSVKHETNNGLKVISKIWRTENILLNTLRTFYL